MDRRTDTEGAAQLHDGQLLSHWKEGNNGICSNMDGPRKHQREKEKYGVVLFICEIQKKKKKDTEELICKTNKLTDTDIKLTDTDIENELTVTSREGLADA